MTYSINESPFWGQIQEVMNDLEIMMTNKNMNDEERSILISIMINRRNFIASVWIDVSRKLAQRKVIMTSLNALFLNGEGVAEGSEEAVDDDDHDEKRQKESAWDVDLQLNFSAWIYIYVGVYIY